MVATFLFGTIVCLGCLSSWYTCKGDSFVSGSNPNVTGLTPSFVISRATSLYDSPINVSLTVYQRPLNNTLRETLRVINGQTNVSSTNRCIAYGVSFKFLGQYPIINSADVGNGGCNAILGRQCAQNLRTALQQSFGAISNSACGINLNFLLNLPQGCPKDTTNSAFVSSTLFNNGSSAANSSVAWIYEQTNTSMSGDYDQIMRYFVFVYFVGRPYSSGIIDSAIACLSAYNETVQTTTYQTTTHAGNFDMRLAIGQNHFVILLLSHIVPFLLFIH